MRLRTLVFIAAISYTLVIGGGLLFYRLFVVYPTIEQATIELHNNNLTAIYASYVNERESLILFNQDWAKWDETYGYIQHHDPEFIERNLSGSFLDTDIDGVAIIDDSGNLRFATTKSYGKFIETDNIEDVSKDLNLESLAKYPDHFDLIRINDKLGYFASHSIQDSEESYPPNGTLVFTRELKADFFHRIRLYTDAEINMFTLSDFQNRFPDIQPQAMVQNNLISTLSDQYFIALENATGTTIGVMEVKYDSTTLPTKIDQTTLFSILSLLLLPIFITIVVWFVFLSPISNMFKQISYMEKSSKLNELNNKSYIWEFQIFTETFNELVNKVHSYQKKLESESQTDGLTGINNRRYFESSFDNAWRFSARNNLPISIVMIDIDYFKKYNDYYGHQAGDEALRAVAKILQTHTRRANDLLARYGGEEFILLHQPDTQDHLTQTLEEVLESINQAQIPHEKSEVSNHITVSAGACLVENPGAWMKDNKELAVKIADQALYKAKEHGRNQFYISHLKPNP